MDLYPVKAQYLCGESVVLRLELEEEYDFGIVYVFSVESCIWSKKIENLREINDIEVGRFENQFAGYGVQLILESNGNRQVLETAFDVTDNPRRSLRYGFVSDFQTKDKNNGAIEQLRKYHINMVQFYDWSYRHDKLVTLQERYQDMMGKNIDMITVKEKIKQAESYGMKTIGYGAVYAASKEFFESHKNWAFYNANQEPFRFIDIFYIMNIKRKSPWRTHLIGQYQKAMEYVGFSGIHMDTYGFPKTAFSHLESQPCLVKLEEEFVSLVDQTRNTLQSQGKDPYLIFNNVGNWPVSKTAVSQVDAVYLEVWHPYERYFHIKQLIENAKNLCENKKPVILAAYLAPFRLEEQLPAAYAAYILTAAIVSNGAYHLLLGENQAVLTQGYYGDYSIMSPETGRIMRKYYDFMIRYLELFYDSTLQDVSMTHIGWDNYEYQCKGTEYSMWGEPGKVWITIRENANYKCLYMVNLCGNEEDYWNKGKNKPQKQKNIVFTISVDHDIQGVYMASPDAEALQSAELEFEYEFNEKGKFVTFCVPELLVWTVVYLKL